MEGDAMVTAMVRRVSVAIAMSAGAGAIWLAVECRGCVAMRPDAREPGWSPRPGEYRGLTVDEMIEAARLDGEVMPADVID